MNFVHISIQKLQQFYWAIILALLFIPSAFVSAQEEVNPQGPEVNPQDPDGFEKLINPLQSIGSLPEFVQKILDVVVTISIPIIALAIIYSGFLFVSAQGSETKLKKARETFMFTLIGAAILLGAVALAQAIGGTIDQLRS